jgi:lia operon protein LiaF
VKILKGITRLFIAVSLIVIGVLLVLFNLGFLTFDFYYIWLYIYPVFFVMVGGKWFIAYFKKEGGSWAAGSFFLLFGILLLLDRFEMIHFTFKDIFKLWPLLIIYIGITVLKESKIIGTYSWRNMDRPKTHNPRSSMFSIGSHEYSSPNWKVEPLHLYNMAGDFYFDFSKAFMPEKEIPISIRSLAGDVTILMTENIAFRVDATVRAGEINVLGQQVEGIINRTITYESEDYDSTIRKIDFTIKLKAGSIRIDYV